jgi:hypothetical protein
LQGGETKFVAPYNSFAAWAPPAFRPESSYLAILLQIAKIGSSANRAGFEI